MEGGGGVLADSVMMQTNPCSHWRPGHLAVSMGTTRGRPGRLQLSGRPICNGLVLSADGKRSKLNTRGHSCCEGDKANVVPHFCP